MLSHAPPAHTARPFGFAGRILHVNLTTGAIQIERPDDAFYRTYLGGSALGMHYIYHEVPARADALGPENILTLAVGPLAGTPISGQSRIAVNAKSPLSGTIGDSQMGGMFPAELKFAGFDALIIKGQSERPVYLWINNGQAELRDATHLWGKITGDVEDLIREELGDARIEIAQCGTAGEKLIRYAAIINMANRAAGRTGMGAVMGSKRLKAIAVRGAARPAVPIADEESFRQLMQPGVAGIQASPAMLTLQTYGTAGMIDTRQLAGELPTHNWQENRFAGAGKLSGETMNSTLLLHNDTCYACAVRCKRVVEHKPYGVDGRYGGPEFQTIATFGAYCGVDHLPSIALANQLCNQHGLDTITTGAAIAFAMDCFMHHIINGTMTDGVELEFGDADAMLWALGKIIDREGIGDTLAEGVDHAAEVWGKGAQELAVTVKGNSAPAHAPRVKRSLALIYAVNPFGPDHQSSEHDPAYSKAAGVEERRRLALLGLNEQLDPADLSAEKVRFAYETQKFYSLLDSASVCQFVYGPSSQLYGPDHLVQALNAVTGWDLTLSELQQIGERRLNLMRAFNAREGFGRAADTLPRKLRKDAGADDELERALDTYYELAGWDLQTGIPTTETLQRLGIQNVSSTP